MKFWGKKPEPFDPEAIRARSKAEIVRLGGQVNEHLPRLEAMPARSGEAIAGRALVLNALANLAREAPVSAIREWIVANGLTQSLSPFEAGLLKKPTEDLTQQELINASWYDEAIYALLWAGGIVEDLPLDAGYPASMLAHVPNVAEDESGRELLRRVRPRSEAELVATLDLYYCAHWFARDGGLNGYDVGVFEISRIMERRKALEWTLDPAADWDDVELST